MTPILYNALANGSLAPPTLSSHTLRLTCLSAGALQVQGSLTPGGGAATAGASVDLASPPSLGPPAADVVCADGGLQRRGLRGQVVVVVVVAVVVAGGGAAAAAMVVARRRAGGGRAGGRGGWGGWGGAKAAPGSAPPPSHSARPFLQDVQLHALPAASAAHQLPLLAGDSVDAGRQQGALRPPLLLLLLCREAVLKQQLRQLSTADGKGRGHRPLHRGGAKLLPLL